MRLSSASHTVRTLLHRAALYPALCATVLLCACATPVPATGSSEAQVRAQWGQPAAEYSNAEGKLLEYNSWPNGQRTWMVQLSGNGVVLSVTQVLCQARFAQIRPDHSTREQVLQLLGHPYEKEWLSLAQHEVWSYPYRESDVWNSMMHIHFDRDGIVRRLENGPDDRYEREARMMRRLFGRRGD